MKFITVDKFKSQPEEIQKVFLDWWQPTMYDLYWYSFSKENDDGFIYCCTNWDQITAIEKLKYKTIPLLTEGQLRQFIEDKTGGMLDFECSELESYHNIYRIVIFEVEKYDDERDFGAKVFEKYMEAKDLLQAYWKVACMVAKEEVDG